MAFSMLQDERLVGPSSDPCRGWEPTARDATSDLLVWRVCCGSNRAHKACQPVLGAICCDISQKSRPKSIRSCSGRDLGAAAFLTLPVLIMLVLLGLHHSSIGARRHLNEELSTAFLLGDS
jgi:hypothetical protein